MSRQAAFTFAAGRQVYELVAPDGTVWVMQTYSQIKDPTLSLADLPGPGVPADAAGRLDLPGADPDRPLVVATAATGRPGAPGQSREQLLGGASRVTASGDGLSDHPSLAHRRGDGLAVLDQDAGRPPLPTHPVRVGAAQLAGGTTCPPHPVALIPAISFPDARTAPTRTP